MHEEKYCQTNDRPYFLQQFAASSAYPARENFFSNERISVAQFRTPDQKQGSKK